MNYWVLSGIVVMIGGFMLRLNALIVVALAALVTGLAGAGRASILRALEDGRGGRTARRRRRSDNRDRGR